jgi:hypothetical protein
MGHTLEQFSSACHRILAEEPGVSGRLKICGLLQEALQDPNFVAANLNDDTPVRKVLYEDPELGFCVLAHNMKGTNESPPHDHGPSWAIYGQALGETVMSDWTVLERPSEGHPGKVKRARSYALKPGMAHLYNEGDVHSPRREGTTWLIRIEGRNMDKVKRLPYQAVETA